MMNPADDGFWLEGGIILTCLSLYFFLYVLYHVLTISRYNKNIETLAEKEYLNRYFALLILYLIVIISASWQFLMSALGFPFTEFRGWINRATIFTSFIAITFSVQLIKQKIT